jgi:hypothetical protein
MQRFRRWLFEWRPHASFSSQTCSGYLDHGGGAVVLVGMNGQTAAVSLGVAVVQCDVLSKTIAL